MFTQLTCDLYTCTSVNHENIRYAVLGSGSSGNSYIFEILDYLILVDAGFKSSFILKKIEELGFSLYKPIIIFCTHTHQDHILGVSELALNTNALVVGTEYLISQLENTEKLNTWCINRDAQYFFEGGSFSTFITSHDAPESLSYQLELYGIRFMVLTDTGYILNSMYRLAFYTHVLFLEANYNEQMLLNGKYPNFLKHRVRGNKGHLSNRQASEFLRKISHTPYIKQLFLCHLSDNNNSEEAVRQDVVDVEPWSWQTIICTKSQSSAVYVCQF